MNLDVYDRAHTGLSVMSELIACNRSTLACIYVLRLRKTGWLREEHAKQGALHNNSLKFGGIKPRSQESRRDDLTRLRVLIKARDLIAPLTRMTFPGDERMRRSSRALARLYSPA